MWGFYIKIYFFKETYKLAMKIAQQRGETSLIKSDEVLTSNEKQIYLQEIEALKKKYFYLKRNFKYYEYTISFCKTKKKD